MQETPRLTICLFKWAGWRNLYELQHVNALSRMLREYLKIPYRIVLLTDKVKQDASAEVDEVLPVAPDPKGLKLIKTVNCFKRLVLFNPEYSRQFGTEFVMSIDLDTLIRADITDLISEAMEHPFGFWIIKGRWADRRTGCRPYNGSLYMLKVGEHRHVFDSFDPIQSPRDIVKIRWVGSDQSWISMNVKGAPTFTTEHGVWFFGQYLQRADKAQQARIISYAGPLKPWTKAARFKNRELYEEYMRWMPKAQVAI